MLMHISRIFFRNLRRHLNMSGCFSDIPVVVVLGSTGAGKSKLAIEIAEEFNGEIISADSMQVYKGLDIISNKVTAEEQAQVPHHMIDIVEPPANYSVVKFRNDCLSIIKDLHKRAKLPVIVGGTNYYIEAVLWKVLIASEEEEEKQNEEGHPAATGRQDAGPADPGSQQQTEEEEARDAAEGRSGEAELDVSSRSTLESLSTEQLYAQLKERDPAQAAVLHPNERRKILRSLEVTVRSGLPMSEHLRQQRSEAGGGVYGGPLRFPRACLLWVTADQATLDRRLDARVDVMLERGLVQELAQFHERYNESRLKEGAEADYTRGVFQSIGFKEFHAYLTRPAATKRDAGVTESDADVTESDADVTKSDAEAARLLAEGVARLKLVTRRYARKQARWVRRRFLSAGDRQVPPVYRLDATNPSEWEQRVRIPAATAVKAWLAGRTPELAPEPCLPAEQADGDRTTYHCEVCGVYTSGAKQRDEHLRSRRHQRALQGRKRRAEAEDEVPAKRGAKGEEGSCVGEEAKGEESKCE